MIMDEAMDKRELVEEELDKVSGGMVIKDKEGRYWVYSDDGTKMFPAYSMDVEIMKDIARSGGWSDKVIENPVTPAKEK